MRVNRTNQSKGSVLVVDDMVENLRLATDMLSQIGYEVRPVRSGAQAILAVANDPPDIILLDINMPEMNGYEVCTKLKEDEKTQGIPVIFISALNEPLDKVNAFGVGGVDYVTKPFDVQEVAARIETHLSLRNTQHKLEKSYLELRALEESRDQLVHMVVHDMRTPMTVIMMNVEVLKSKLKGQISESSMEIVNQCIVGSQRLQSMTNNLLDLSRLEANQMPVRPEDCDLAKLVEEIVEEGRRLSESRTIVCDVPREVLLRCDKGLVRRVLENLLGNALYHTETSTEITVSVLLEADFVRVSVQDRGAGVPKESREEIFKKFSTLSDSSVREHHSVGLGLVFCKLAVEALGGVIGVESEVGEGSTFWFSLPR